jgi:hypothetical protein
VVPAEGARAAGSAGLSAADFGALDLVFVITLILRNPWTRTRMFLDQ